MATQRRYDAIDDPHHMLLVVELRLGLAQLAPLLDVHGFWPIDHHFGYAGVLEIGLDRAVASDLGVYRLEQPLPLHPGEDQPFLLHNLIEEGLYRGSDLGVVAQIALWIQLCNNLGLDAGLHIAGDALSGVGWR